MFQNVNLSQHQKDIKCYLHLQTICKKKRVVKVTSRTPIFHTFLTFHYKFLLRGKSYA